MWVRVSQHKYLDHDGDSTVIQKYNSDWFLWIYIYSRELNVINIMCNCADKLTITWIAIVTWFQFHHHDSYDTESLCLNAA